MVKTCKTCATEKPLTMFAKNGGSKYRSVCKSCRNDARRARYQTDPEFRASAVENARRQKGKPRSAEQMEKRRAYKERRRREAGSLPLAEHRQRIRSESATSRKKPKREPLHDAHVRALRSDDAAYMRWRVATDPAFRLNMRLRVQIRKALKGNKRGRSWESFVGYSLDDLVRHFARMLPRGKTLEQCLADGWHIDHIVPKSLFNLAEPGELRAAWALPNLRLIPAAENLRKSARQEHLL